MTASLKGLDILLAKSALKKTLGFAVALQLLFIGLLGTPSETESAPVKDQTVEEAYPGLETLRQLLVTPQTPPSLPAVSITDSPRFTWRGAMLDVARHFFGIEDVKRYIDLISHYKMNRLHLHLTDDQGWRIEIKSWPRLTELGGRTQVGGGGGGFYTQEQYKEIVEYAASRYVIIVPESDTPGHNNAALASYAELNASEEAPALYEGSEVGFSTLNIKSEIAYQFLDDVIRELAAISPAPYIHIGGDEAPVVIGVTGPDGDATLLGQPLVGGWEHRIR